MLIKAIIFVLATHSLVIGERLGGGYKAIIYILAALVVAWLNFKPNRRNKDISFRLNVLEGGRRLLKISLYSEIIQIVSYAVYINRLGVHSLNDKIIIIDFVIMLVITFLTWANAMLRILCTSKWLSVIKRIICFVFMYTPIINIIVMYYMCKTAYYEYEYNVYKIAYQNIKVEGDTCSTKYPLVLIHGVGFRDARFFNYWGRIPKELTRLGANIYYGNQEGWGTVEYNAKKLKEKIEQILKENGCDKVNIIAHSKGGLDSRYMISKLDMADKVASLTMMSTPNRGVKMVDRLVNLPKCIFKSITRFVNCVFKKYGDEKPDFESVVYAFTTKACAEFNDEVKDSPKVYYQSYSACMKNFFSDYILCVPYLYIKIIEGDNDGLVTLESAKWGNYRGVMKNRYRRGVSHGDLIDLKREDFRGFDVVEEYVEL